MKDWEKKARSWAWERLVFLADRISPEDAFRKMSGLTVQLKVGEGWVLNSSRDGKGVPIWYRGQQSYDDHRHDGYDEGPVALKTVISTGGITLSSDMTEEEAERVVRNALWWGVVNR